MILLVNVITENIYNFNIFFYLIYYKEIFFKGGFWPVLCFKPKILLDKMYVIHITCSQDCLTLLRAVFILNVLTFYIQININANFSQ